MPNTCTVWSWLDSIDIILLVFATYIGIYVTKKGIKSISTNKTITTFFKVSYYGMIVSYLVASYGFFIDLILYHLSKSYQNDISTFNMSQTIRYTIKIITFSSYYILLISLFSILITRLMYTFKDSAHSLSPQISNIFYSISIISAILTFIGFITTNHLISTSLQTFSILIYLISILIMITIFFKKLNFLILSVSGSKINLNHVDSMQSRNMQINLINHATKYIILTFACFIISFIVMFINFIVNISSNSTCILHRIFIIWFIKINLVINILCFYLQFAFSKHDYTKLCQYFDNKLKRNAANLKPPKDINDAPKNTTQTVQNTFTMANTNLKNISNAIAMPTPSLQSVVLLKQNIDISLDRIDFNGNIINGRGTSLPKRFKKDSIRWSVDIGAVKEEKYNHDNPKEKQLFKKSDFVSSPTLMSTQIDNQMMNDMHLSLPVNTIVFEFGNVLCTQIQVLHNKMSTFLATKDNKTKQMYFGGIERLDMLKQWLDGIHNNNMLCFIMANEQSKMIVNLLQDVGLLKYFVRVHPQDNKKWLSHIFGFDHRITNDASGKRHLMLLKLLQSLQRKHDQMLYIGNDDNVLQHINSIQLCKTYLVETKGLLKSDLDEIKQMYL